MEHLDLPDVFSQNGSLMALAQKDNSSSGSLCKTAVVKRVRSNPVYSPRIRFVNKQEGLNVRMQYDLLKPTTKKKRL